MQKYCFFWDMQILEGIYVKKEQFYHYFLPQIERIERILTEGIRERKENGRKNAPEMHDDWYRNTIPN